MNWTAKAENGYRYEWSLRADNTLHHRLLGTKPWKLSAINVMNREKAEEFITGFHRHTDLKETV